MSHGCACSTISNRTTEERSREIRRAGELADKIRSMGGVAIQNRSYRLRNYHSCFIASELVTWLIHSGEAETRKEGVMLGQMLVDTDFIHHVLDEHNFDDKYLFFRFRQDEPPQEAMQGPSVAYLKGEQGTIISLLAKKRSLVGWSYFVFALAPGNKTLYQFRSQLDSYPITCYSLENASVQPSTPTNGGRFLLQFYQNHDTGRVASHCLAADSSDTQFTWIRALSGCGVEILTSMEEEDDMVKNATSIYEFSALDIDGVNIPLAMYRGFLTLIVNVASQ